MSQSPQAYQPYSCVKGEIAVALGHREQVLDVLRRAGVPARLAQHSVELDLALVSLLVGDDVAADALDRLEPPRPDDPRPPAGDDLGRVIAGIRRYFSRRHHGWSVTLGKNRYVASVSGGSTDGGAVSHGGGGSPRRTWRHPARPVALGPGRGVRVGVLDTALFPHPWLNGRWTASQADLLPPGEQRAVRAGHGTFVTGLVLSQAPGATVDVRGVLEGPRPQDDDGRAPYTATAWQVAKDIVSFRSAVDILNLSLVCATEDGEAPLVLARAVDRLGPDVVVVAAAGNHGALPRQPAGQRPRRVDADTAMFPAALEGVIAVGAADSHGLPLPITPVNKCWIDLLVRGDDLVSTYLSGRLRRDDGTRTWFLTNWARWNGSSFAAALLSGAIAAGTDPGRVSARQALETIRSTARQIGDSADANPPFVDLRIT